MMWKQRLLNNRWQFEDVISAHRIEQLNNLLPYPLLPQSQLPLLYHFIFLTPSSSSNGLDPDGYDSYQSPPSFKTRLWIGGQITQHGAIPVGSNILLSEEVKKVRELNGSTIVEIERSIEGDNGPLLTEVRRLMYLNSTYVPIASKSNDMVPIASETVRLTTLDLMRYSSLTYNSHKIHYDREYAVQIEKYPNIVIHGPLLVTLSINFLTHKVPEYAIRNIQYKNVQPLFVHDDLKMNMAREGDNYRVWINNSAGKLCCSCVIY